MYVIMMMVNEINIEKYVDNIVSYLPTSKNKKSGYDLP